MGAPPRCDDSLGMIAPPSPLFGVVSSCRDAYSAGSCYPALCLYNSVRTFSVEELTGCLGWLRHTYGYPAPYADSGPEEEGVPVDQVPGSVLSVWALVSLG